MINVQPYIEKLDRLKKYMDAWIEIKAQRILSKPKFELMHEIRKL